MTAPVPTQCHHCGEFDTAPKAHWNTGGTWHHHCLSAANKEEFVVSHPNGKEIMSAVNNGVRGDELRALILDLHAKEGN